MVLNQAPKRLYRWCLQFLEYFVAEFAEIAMVAQTKEAGGEGWPGGNWVTRTMFVTTRHNIRLTLPLLDSRLSRTRRRAVTQLDWLRKGTLPIY